LILQASRDLPRTIQFIHFTGKKSPPLGAYYDEMNVRAYTAPFEPRMEYAWAASDAVLSRAGASTVAEALLCRVPPFFIPFPFGQDNHQEKNSEYVVHTVQGGQMLRQSECTPSILRQHLQNFLAPDNLALMRKNIDTFYQQSKPKDFYEEVIATIGS